MSLTLKIGSLVIRTLAKPIGNYIKRNAHDHERFRKLCVGFAQRLHRLDMRMRLGLLQDPAVIERQIAKELAEAEAKRKKSQIPTVKTEAQMKADESAAAREKREISEKAKGANKSVRIRPLSESKAIETGANFISETFLFLVAGGLIIFENFRSRRKESNRREGVADRIEALEAENATLKTHLVHLDKVISSLESKQGKSLPEPQPTPKDLIKPLKPDANKSSKDQPGAEDKSKNSASS